MDWPRPLRYFHGAVEQTTGLLYLTDKTRPRKCLKLPQQEKCRPRKSHYFHCLCTYPSVCKASHIHGLTIRWVSILSRSRMRRWCYLLSFLPKGGYEIITVDHYSRLDNAPRLPSRYIVVHSVYIIYFYDDFWLSVSTYGTHCLFDMIYCSLDYSYFYYAHIFILLLSRWFCSFKILFRSSDYCFLTGIIIYDLFIFCFSLISILNYKYLCKIYHDLFTIICTYFLIYSLNLIFW